MFAPDYQAAYFVRNTLERNKLDRAAFWMVEAWLTWKRSPAGKVA